MFSKFGFCLPGATPGPNSGVEFCNWCVLKNSGISGCTADARTSDEVAFARAVVLLHPGAMRWRRISQEGRVLISCGAIGHDGTFLQTGGCIYLSAQISFVSCFVPFRHCLKRHRCSCSVSDLPRDTVASFMAPNFTDFLFFVEHFCACVFLSIVNVSLKGSNF